jgi:hypothetical protein
LNKYAAIIDFQMNEHESKAYKLAVIWEEETKKMFPEEKLARLPQKSDPRKCTLFKYCWKLMRETRGLLKDQEYKLYIMGNLQILRANRGRIEPNALCGDKAWIRWLVWKKMYDKKVAEINQATMPPELNIPPQVQKEISCTKRFLFEKFEGEPTIEKLQTTIDRGNIRMWVKSGKISMYYLVLSPWIDKTIGLDKMEKDYGFDASVYKSKMTPSILDYFKNEFKHEYQ